MPTGPEHYDQAEKLLEESATALHPSDADRIIAEAQVHATLALAAATALNDHSHAEGGMRIEDYDAWHQVASAWQPKQKGGDAR